MEQISQEKCKNILEVNKNKYNLSNLSDGAKAIIEGKFKTLEWVY